ncbi:MAG: bifunctional folylpolyglutamate synthase/dihydrofolate synthase [Clostridia bacterium]|nr:bifunctional folylpolyglutamate synthase/dihydrofolate synthase [Clostridia bacterium]
MTYDEAVAWLHGMPRYRSEPTLERMERLLSLLGDPHKELAGKILHVAGTNGKGSVCAFLTHALTRSGYRVGRFISPFIMEFRERMEINGEMIPKREVVSICKTLQKCVERFTEETGCTPLEFELVTAMGLYWFAEQRCDFLVLEVGVGGKYDPTNVVDPLLSVITRVDYDHTEVLGPTLRDIAAQKAGIVKEGRPCVISPDNPEEALDVIRCTCEAMHSNWIRPERTEAKILSAELGRLAFSYRQTDYELRLSGLYQIGNALCAIEAMRILASLPCGAKVTEKAVRAGLSETTFPARFEPLSSEPPVILEGAHNLSGFRALRENLDYYCQDQPLLFLCGMLRDKNPADCLDCLPLSRVCFAACVTPPSPRAMTGEELAELFREKGTEASGFPSVRDALSDLKRRNRTCLIPVICFGSLYVAGAVRRAFSLPDESTVKGGKRRGTSSAGSGF